MADLKAHQGILESLLSDTTRVSYCLKNFKSIRRAERDDREPEKIGRKVQPFHGWSLIEDKNHDEIAICLLSEDWGGKKAVSSIFRMADKVARTFMKNLKRLKKTVGYKRGILLYT